MTHIAIDMDDVLVDFVGGLRAAVQTEFGVELTEESIREWNLHSTLDPIIGYSWWTWLKNREWIWATFPAMPGAIGYIERLRSDGHYLELLTNKPRWAEHNVWKWLGKWRPAFNTVTIVEGGSKPSPVDGTNVGNKKIDFSAADILVDDKPQNCQEFIDAGRHAILFARPHNQDALLKHDGHDQGHGFIAWNWAEVYDKITEWSQENG